MAFNILSYNVHDFEQGELLLAYLCDEAKYDVMFIQEHWLAPNQLYKLCTINPDYTCAGISAMEDILS